jgi:hypothetical protein
MRFLKAAAAVWQFGCIDDVMLTYINDAITVAAVVGGARPGPVPDPGEQD